MSDRPLLRPAADWRATPLARVFGPIEEFMHASAAGGMVLFGAAALAVALANSSLAGAYAAAIHTSIGVSLGPFALRETASSTGSTTA